MDAFITYQQDTTGVKSLIHAIPKSMELNDIFKQKPVSILEIPERKEAAEVLTKKKYTANQIRNWQMQQEKKLLVNDSRYIVPRTNLVVSHITPKNTGLILPTHQRQNANTDWLTAILFLALFIFATIRYASKKYMNHLFLSLFNYATSTRMLKERNYPLSHAAFRLNIIFYITFSIFIFQLLNVLKFKNALTSPTYYLKVLGFVLLYFLGKKLIYLALGLLFEATYETREFLFNHDNFNRSLGLILLPVIILISFSPVRTPVFIVFIGLAILLILYLLLLQRGIFILLKKQFPLCYLFLYLCTLEFLPLLLIYKVVVE